MLTAPYWGIIYIQIMQILIWQLYMTMQSSFRSMYKTYNLSRKFSSCSFQLIPLYSRVSHSILFSITWSTLPVFEITINGVCCLFCLFISLEKYNFLFCRMYQWCILICSSYNRWISYIHYKRMVYHNLFIYSPVDGHLNCFKFGNIMNIVALNIFL